jgi:hypothetical protein
MPVGIAAIDAATDHDLLIGRDSFGCRAGVLVPPQDGPRRDDELSGIALEGDIREDAVPHARLAGDTAVDVERSGLGERETEGEGIDERSVG